MALFCLTQILREDALESQSLVFEFLRTGMLRYVLESVADVNLNGCEADDIRSLEHCNVVLVGSAVYFEIIDQNQYMFYFLLKFLRVLVRGSIVLHTLSVSKVFRVAILFDFIHE